MLQTAIKNYYTFFDETLQNSTCIVLMVTLLVLLVGAIVPSANANAAHLMKASILDTSVWNTLSATNVVVIDGEEYEIVFSKISK